MSSTSSLREIERAREEAFAFLFDYGSLAREWNDPDDDHTRIQIRALADEVIEAVFRDA